MLKASVHRKITQFDMSNTSLAREALDIPYPKPGRTYLSQMVRWIRNTQGLCMHETPTFESL